CVLLLPRSPLSTLFPYTTLFRSVGDGVFVFATGLRIDAQDLAEERLDVLAVVVWIATATAVSQADVEQPIGAKGDRAALVILHLDRKSTRLNSSHVKISYAVFCL